MNRQGVQDLNFCPYQLLELQEFQATDKDIKSAYRNLALKWHPDRNKAPNARDMFEKIKLASEILLSQTLRPIYDDLLKAKKQQQERIEKSNQDRRVLMEELIRREKEYQDALNQKMSQPKPPEEQKFESEIEKLIRQIKKQEQEEKEQQKERKKQDHISSLFDQSTIKVVSNEEDQVFTEGYLKNLFQRFGIIDGVIIDRKQQNKGFVMFRHRDSALKVINRQEEDENEFSEFKMKIVSTSKAQNREEKWRIKQAKKDPIDILKNKLFGKDSEYVLGKRLNCDSLEEMEQIVFAKIKALKQSKNKE